MFLLMMLVENWLKTNFVDVVENYDFKDEVHPDDSVFHVASRDFQWKSSCSGKHSHNNAKSSRIKAAVITLHEFFGNEHFPSFFETLL